MTIGEKMSVQATIYEETIRINGFDCDVNRRWKPSACFQYLTEAAGNHAAKLGFGFETMLEKNLFWVLSRMKVKFFDFPQMGEQVILRTWPKTIQQKLFFIRDFELVNAQGTRLAAATSAWLVISATTRRMIPPQSLDLDLPSNPDRYGLDEPLEKLFAADTGEERLRLKAGYSTVDMLGHVNNSHYVEWICDTFPMEEYQKRRIDWMQVNYDHEIRPGEEVALLASHDGNDNALWTVEGVNCNNQTRAFTSVLKWR